MVIRSVFCEVSFDGIFPLSSRSYFMGVWSFLCASVQVRLCVWVCNCVSVSQRWHCSWQKYVPGLGLRWLWFVSDQGWHTGQHSNTQLLSLSWFSTISLWFVIPSPLSLSLSPNTQAALSSINLSEHWSRTARRPDSFCFLTPDAKSRGRLSLKLSALVKDASWVYL